MDPDTGLSVSLLKGVFFRRPAYRSAVLLHTGKFFSDCTIHALVAGVCDCLPSHRHFSPKDDNLGELMFTVCGVHVGE